MKGLLPLPPFFSAAKVEQIWPVPYQQRMEEARNFAQQYQIAPAHRDRLKVCLLLIDVQNTFCLPEFELFVGGRSGRGAIEDNIRLCEFIYRHLGSLTHICATLDTHQAMQIFHPIFWVNALGDHPAPTTSIDLTDIEQGRWRVNPAIAFYLQDYSQESLQEYALHYVRQLSQQGKYQLTIWPYHSMLGGIGHALVAAVEEALFFHSVARQTQTQFELKGSHPLTENYSVLGPEVSHNQQGQLILAPNQALIEQLLQFDRILVAGQAKSHCVAWTVHDLVRAAERTDPRICQQIYLLEDCMSPVVIPGVVDFTDLAEQTFQNLANRGIHRINSQENLSWL